MDKPRNVYKKCKWLFGKTIEIPAEWDIKKLTDIGEIVGGGTPNSKNDEYWNGDVLWAVPSDITKLSTTYIEDTARKITKNGLKNSSAKILPIGTILLTSRATMGECAIAAKPISTNQGFQSIICNNIVDSVFVFYLMKFNRNTVIRLSYGTTFLEISKKEIEKILVPVPNSITEQQKIASILSRVDACIESTQKVIDKTERLKKGLMQQLLTRGIGHKKFKKVKWLFGKEIEIPEEWKWDMITNYAEITTGDKDTQNKITDGKYPFFVRSQHVENINSYSYDGEAVLTAGDGVGTGKVFHYINGKFDFHQRVYKISDFASQLSGYFFYLYFSQNFLYQVLAMSAKNSVDSVRMEMIAKMKVPIPPLPEQARIASILSGVDAYIQKNQEYKGKLEHLKKGLMQKLLTGQIRVKI